MSQATDSSLDPMEEIRFRKKHSKLWQEIAKTTHFTFDELEAIMVIYYKIAIREGKSTNHLITRPSFRDVLHAGLNMTDSYMMERIMVAIDKGTSPTVSMESFAHTFSLYLRGSLQEKIDYCFACYDIMGESMLRREHIFQLLKRILIKTFQDDDVEAAIKELIDILMKRMDLDYDGNISYDDYKTTVIETPRMLEAFGICLPDRHRVHAFVATWSPLWAKV